MTAAEKWRNELQHGSYVYLTSAESLPREERRCEASLGCEGHSLSALA
jgi:hypothetical protein